jgi:hypothetical protein
VTGSGTRCPIRSENTHLKALGIKRLVPCSNSFDTSKTHLCVCLERELKEREGPAAGQASGGRPADFRRPRHEPLSPSPTSAAPLLAILFCFGAPVGLPATSPASDGKCTAPPGASRPLDHGYGRGFHKNSTVVELWASDRSPARIPASPELKF